MKLVFRKYMEFENSLGNENKLAELRRRVEQYLETIFKADDSSSAAAEEKDGEDSAASQDNDKDVEEGSEEDEVEGEGDSVESEIESDE